MAKAPPPPARSARRTAIAASVAPDVQTEQWGGHNPPPPPPPPPPAPPPPAPSTDAITQLLLAVLTKANEQIPSTGLTGPALAVAQRFQKLSAQLSTLADPPELRALRDIE